MSKHFISHHGVLGMRWGVRRGPPYPLGAAKAAKNQAIYKREGRTDSSSTNRSGQSTNRFPTSRTPSGETVTFTPRNKGKAISAIRRILGSEDRLDDEIHFDIVADGVRIGYTALTKEGSNLYVDWIGINSKHRGKQYGTHAMNVTKEYARDNGYKSISLDSINDRSTHVYRKVGFVEDRKNTNPEEHIGVLMKLNLEERGR